jgi:predicted small lipoprotein YifL
MSIDLPFVELHVRWQPAHGHAFRSNGFRLPAVLLFLCVLAFVLSGCGTSDRGPYESPPTNRVANVAWQEWTKFGRSTVVYGGGNANGYVNRLGLSERSEPLSTRVGDYWGSCGHPEWNGRSAGRPWSGAFVSWVMAHAGVGPREFPPAGRHGTYLAEIYAREHTSRPTAFVLRAPTEYVPRPGDLVCSGTAGASWRYADARTAKRRIDSTAAHCDIVVETRGGYLQAIGGNVKNSVTMSLFPVDSRGRLLNVPGRPWLLVAEDRAS